LQYSWEPITFRGMLLIRQSGLEAFMMLQEYARRHVLTCLIPEHYIQALVGGNSLWANFFASIVGALMYFATLTEVPILQGLLGSGMGKGPVLGVLLADHALSLPSMIAIASILVSRKQLCTALSLSFYQP